MDGTRPSASDDSKVGACGGALCLHPGRFQIEVDWVDYSATQGQASSVPFGSETSGLLWFFQQTNWEMLVKVIDGCSFNGNFWVFAAATTDVQYTRPVTDTVTGAGGGVLQSFGTGGSGHHGFGGDQLFAVR